MAYSCIKHLKEECDGCGDCKEKLYCCICDKELTQDEAYELGGDIYCEKHLLEQCKI